MSVSIERETYPVVVDDLDNDGELTGGGALLDEDNAADLNVALERSGHFYDLVMVKVKKQGRIGQLSCYQNCVESSAAASFASVSHRSLQKECR